MVEQPAVFRFGDLELHEGQGELRRGEARIPLEPLPLRLLDHLIQQRHRFVSKEELLRELWPDTVVSESALTTALKEVRRAVGDTGQRQAVIRTLRGRGWRFVAPVEERPSDPPRLRLVGRDDGDPAEAPPTALPPHHPRRRLALALEMALSAQLSGEQETALGHWLVAADLARDLDDSDGFCRAVRGVASATRFIGIGLIDEGTWRPLVEEALERSGPAPSNHRAALLARLSQSTCFDDAERVAMADEALAIARALDDAEATVFALFSQYLAHWRPEDARRRLRIATQMVEPADASGNWMWPIEARRQRYIELLAAGDREAADAETESILARVARLRSPVYDEIAAQLRAARATWEGRFQKAGEILTEAEDPARQPSAPGRQGFAAQRQLLRVLQGPIDKIQLGELPEGASPPQVLSLWTRALQGPDADVRRAFERLGARGFDDLPHDPLANAAVLATLAETCARLGDRAHAERLYALLLPLAGCNVVYMHVLYFGCASRYLGLLAQTLDRLDDAKRHFEEALELQERFEARPWRALTQRDLASLWLHRGAAGSAEYARALVEGALATARKLGMRPLADEAAALHERLGRVRPLPGRRAAR